MVDLKLKVPDSFFCEEERSGYLVTKKMKEVWAVELDLFAEFDRVCRKYDIQYFASSGTMLGAVRHQGFIPWDDDMDVMMLRDQYEKLCSVATKEFKAPYFFQTEYTDYGSLRGHAQLRNSMTTGALIDEMNQKLNINQGIFFDIFPLDALPNNVSERNSFLKEIKKTKNKVWRYANLTVRYKPAKSILKRPIKHFLHLLTPDNKDFLNREYKSFEILCQKYNSQETDYIDLISFRANDKYKRKRKYFQEMIYVPFEFLEIPICKEYDSALTDVFGDWHKLIKGSALHGQVVFDTEHSYIDYLRGDIKYEI